MNVRSSLATALASEILPRVALIVLLVVVSAPVVGAQSPVRKVPRLQGITRAMPSLDTLEIARARYVPVRALDRSDRESLASAFLQRLGDRELTEETATEVSLAVLYEAALLAGRSQGEIDAARLDVYLAALQQRQRQANEGSELRMVELQSQMQQRSQLIQLSTSLIKALADSDAALIRNLR